MSILLHNSMGSSELLQRLQNLGVVGLLPQLVDLHPSDLALRVHDEHSAVVDERYFVFCGRKDTIIRGGFGVRPAVRSQGELKPPQRFLESDMGENRICTDAHDLGVEAGKASEIRLDCRQLVPSNGGKVKGVEADHHIFAALGGKLKLALRGACRRTKPEIRRLVSNL